MPSQSEWHASTRVDPSEAMEVSSWKWMAASTIVAASTLTAIIQFGFALSTWITASVVATVSLLTAIGYRIAKSQTPTFLEDEEDLGVCYVKVTIFQEGVVTGWDRGAAYFDGDRLVYAGNRMSFALGGQDVYSVDQMEQIGIRHPRRRVALKLKPIDRSGKEFASAIPFSRNLRRFAKGKTRTNEPRQYPPLSIGSMIRVPRFEVRHAWILVGIVLALIIPLGLLLHQPILYSAVMVLASWLGLYDSIGSTVSGDAWLHRRSILLTLQRDPEAGGPVDPRPLT